MTADQIDFKALARAALSSADRLVAQWLPGGKRDGHEFKALNPKRADSHLGSFSVNLNTGVWRDFATDDGGGDLISLYAYLFDVKQIDAARSIAEAIGFELNSNKQAERTQPVAASKSSRGQWVPVLPVPAGCEENYPVAHIKRGKPDVMHRYLSAEGLLNGFSCVFKKSDGGKEVIPLCFAKNSETGEQGWRWMAFPELRPLYGLQHLAGSSLPVLLVEGEKCADRAAGVLRDFVCISWPGGAKAVNKIDWSPLADRAVYAWADCDAQRVKLTQSEMTAGVDPGTKPLLTEYKQPGMQAMLRIKALVEAMNGGGQFHIVDIPAPGGKPSGWDVADAIDEGMTEVQLNQFILNVRDVSTAVDEAAKSDDFSYLLKNFALVYSTDTIYDMNKHLLLKVNNFKYAFPQCGPIWLKSPDRKMIDPDDLVFDPSERCKPPKINMYDGLSMSPKPGDCEAILELLRHLCADSADAADEIKKVVNWTLKWLALPLQQLGTKMRSALVFHGPQGTGKNLFFEIVASIYGRYSTIVSQAQIDSEYNDWAANKLFMIGDEVIARNELFHQKNQLKVFITGDTIQIHGKFLPFRSEKNHVNIVFLSNENQPLALEVGDRRYFVVYTPPMRDDGLYKRVVECLKDGGGAAFYDYLLKLDLTGFSAFDIPPMTTAKRDLIDLGLRPSERFVREWLRNQLPLPIHACSSEQLFRAFKYWSAANNERFNPNQQVFTASARRHIQYLSRLAKRHDYLCYKEKIRLPKQVNGQDYVRGWIPDGEGPREGQSEGEWMGYQITYFESYIDTYKQKIGGKEQ